MSRKVRAELEIATNVAQVVRGLEQLLGQLSKDRLLELDLGPATQEIRDFMGVVTQLERRIESAVRPLEKLQMKNVGSVNSIRREIRDQVIPELMKSQAAQQMRAGGASEMLITRRMLEALNKRLLMPDSRRAADSNLGNIKANLLPFLRSVGISEKEAAGLAGRLHDARSEVVALNQDLGVLNTQWKTVASTANKATKTLDQASREQARIVDNTVATTTKMAVAQSKALAESTSSYRREIARMASSVKSDFTTYNESTVKGLLTSMRREYADMKALRDDMARQGTLNTAQASHFQRNLLARQALIESFEHNTSPALAKRAIDQQFANDRRIQQLGAWKKIDRAQEVSELVRRYPSSGNVASLGRQATNLEKMAATIASQRALYEKGDRKLGIKKDLGYAQMLQILETNLQGKSTSYRNQYDAARVLIEKRAMNLVPSALGTGDLTVTNAAYARTRNLRGQQARIEEIRNTIDRAHRGKTSVGSSVTDVLRGEIGGLDTYIAEGERRLGHKNIGAAETEELHRTLTEMRKLREKYTTDLAGYVQREVEIQKAADREVERSARQKLTEFRKLNQLARNEEAKEYVQGLLRDPNRVNKLGKDDVVYARAMVQQTHHMFRQGVEGVPDELQMAGVRNALDARAKQLRSATFGQRMLASFGFRGGGAYGRENDSVLHHVNKRVTNMAQMMGTSLYGMGILGLGSAVAGGTIGQAAQKETLTNTLAGLINSYAKFTDVTGLATSAQENFQRSLDYSGKVYDMLREKAVQSILTTSEMFDYFMSGAPQLMARGMNIEQSLKIVDVVASLGKAMGLSSTAVQSDVRDLAMGNVTVRSQVLRTMGMDSGELRAARSQGPQALEAYFERIISGVKPALDRLEETTTSKLSRFMDTLQQMGIKFGEVMIPIVLPYLQEFEKSIVAWVQSGNAEKFAKSFAGMIGTIFSALEWFVTNAAPYVDSIEDILIGGVVLILAKTSAQALAASSDFRAAMASLLPVMIDMTGAASDMKRRLVTNAAGTMVTQEVAGAIMAGGARGRMAAAFPTFASAGSKFSSSIAETGFWVALGTAIKGGFKGLGTLIASAGRGLVAAITSATGLVVLALTAAIASIMILKKVIDNDRENVAFLENMNDRTSGALQGKGATPEQILEARRRAYTENWDITNPNAFKEGVLNPNASLASSLNEAERTTSERMSKYGASWNTDWARSPVNSAIKNTLNSRVDTQERAGWLVRNLNAMYPGRNFSDMNQNSLREAVQFVQNNRGVQEELQKRLNAVRNDPELSKKLESLTPIWGGMNDPEMSKRLADTRLALDASKTQGELTNLERSSERAARQIAVLADSAQKGGVYLKARAVSDKATADTTSEVLKFRMAEKQSMAVLTSTDQGVDDIQRLTAANDLIKAQTEQARAIERIQEAYNDQLRQIRDSILAQRDEIAMRKEQVRVAGLQVEADRKKMELARMDYQRSGNLSGYMRAYNRAFDADMLASTAGFSSDVSTNRREVASIRRQADSDSKVQAFFGKSVRDQQFAAAKLMTDSVNAISRVYIDSSNVVAESANAQVSATATAVAATNDLNNSVGQLTGAVNTLTQTIQNQAPGANPGATIDTASQQTKVDAAKKELDKAKAEEEAYRAQIQKRVRASFVASGGDPNNYQGASVLSDKIAEALAKDANYSAYTGMITHKQAKYNRELERLKGVESNGSVGQYILEFANKAKSKGVRYDFGATITDFNKNLADCSSYVSILASDLGLLSKGARETTLSLYDKSKPISGSPQAGDLVFVSGTQRRAGVSHVGMMINGTDVAQMGNSGAKVMSLDAFKKIGKFEGIRRLGVASSINATLPAAFAGVDTSVLKESQRALDELALQQKQLELWGRVTERVNELNQKFNELIQTTTQLAGAFENSIGQIHEQQRSALSVGLTSVGPGSGYSRLLSTLQAQQQGYMSGTGVEYLDPQMAAMLGIVGGGRQFGSLGYNTKSGTYAFTGFGSYQQRMSASEQVLGEALMIRNALVGNNGSFNPGQLELIRRNMVQRRVDENPGMLSGDFQTYLGASNKTFSQVIQAARSGDPDQMGLIPEAIRKEVDTIFAPLTQEFLSGAMKNMFELVGTLNEGANRTAIEMEVASAMLQSNSEIFNQKFGETFQKMSNQISREADLIGLVGQDLADAVSKNQLTKNLEDAQEALSKGQQNAFQTANSLGVFKPLEGLMQQFAPILGSTTLNAAQKQAQIQALGGNVQAIIESLPEGQRSAFGEQWLKATSNPEMLSESVTAFFGVLREAFIQGVVDAMVEGDAEKVKQALFALKQGDVDSQRMAARREANNAYFETVSSGAFARRQSIADQRFSDIVGGSSMFAPLGGASAMDQFNRQYDLARTDIERGADTAVAAERARLAGTPEGQLLLQQNPNYFEEFRRNYIETNMRRVRNQYVGQFPGAKASQMRDQAIGSLASSFVTDPMAYISGRRNFGEEIGNILSPITGGQQSIVSDSFRGLMNVFTMKQNDLLGMYPQFARVRGMNGMIPQLGFSRGAALQQFGYNLAGNLGGNLLGNFLGGSMFGNRDPQSIGAGASMGTALGGFLGTAGTGVFGASGLFGLGAAAGPVGMLVGGALGSLVGGLFGGRKRDPEEEEKRARERQHQQRLEELLSRIDRSLRPMPDYLRTLRNDVLYGTASGWYSGRNFASLGRQVAVAGR